MNKLPLKPRVGGSFADVVAEAQGVKPTVPDLLLDAVAKAKANAIPLIDMDFTDLELRVLAHSVSPSTESLPPLPFTEVDKELGIVRGSPTGRLNVEGPADQMKDLTDKLRQSERGELGYSGGTRSMRMSLPTMDNLPKIDPRVMKLFKSTEGTPHLSVVELVDGMRSPVSYPLVLKKVADSDS